MKGRVLLLVVGAVVFISAGAAFGASLFSLDDERKAAQKLELLDWDLEAEEDGCDNVQTTLWSFLTKPDDDAIAKERVEAMVRSAAHQKGVAVETRPYIGREFRSAEPRRRADIMGHPGAALLSEGDIRMGAEFIVAAEQKQKSLSNYSSAFASIKDETQLESLWTEWQQQLQPDEDDDYSNFLRLTEQTASLNRERNLENLWEMQTEWSDGYAKAKRLWAEIEPLYLKFHDYVRRRLQKIYPDVPENIPVHLLGSPEGVDWTFIAKETLLQEELIKSLESAISQQNKEQLYRRAQQMSHDFGLPDLGRSFWEQSEFAGRCPSEVISACSDEGVRVVTCNSSSRWADYLEANENIFRGSYFNLAARSNSYVFRHGNRFSAIPEAVSSLGGLLAAASSVDSEGLVSRDPSDPLGQAVNLRLLVALRTLPRLPALLAADLCRIRDAPFPSRPLPPSCWQDRTKMQKVAPPSSLSGKDVFDLFADRAVTANAPHLSEFAGTILQFQLYEYLTKSSGLSRRDLFKIGIQKLQADDNFRSLLRGGLALPWPKLLEEHLNITEISTAPLLKFFKPLLPVFDDMSPVDEIPDYDANTEYPPEVSSSSPSPPPPPSPTPRIREVKSSTLSPKPEVVEVSTSETETDVPTESNLAQDEVSTSQPTTYIAIGGILLGVVIVVAAIFIVNRRRKKRPEIRKSSNGATYEAVIRRSAGRPASFSPVVAKRLSENGNEPPLPLFSTFSSSTESPTESIPLEETNGKLSN
ncbi:angiotensin-converting enzyme-like [Neocloeon triangulifer]|uniref:angiotensin-converting enzyme-like n=1 Tax=Neocloeon triangulifer TaxID=2078957 RepID=UPI00286F4BC1|nr:angiotensin-converting enzyme-like [Neocloeon triangulifer]